AIVGHQVDDELLGRIAEAATRLLPEIEAGVPRKRDVEHLKRAVFAGVPVPDGALIEHFPDCVVSGSANPLGVNIKVHRQGGDAVARVTLGHAFEGAPRRAHGGIVAAIFDDVLGYVLAVNTVPAFTGRLTVSYLAPTPMGAEIEFRARLLRRQGRKLFMEAEANSGGHRVAQAEGVFIAIPPERLGLPPEPAA
ncbi:MAG: PaaI family thioesterase, partial [Acidimicrobiia bacterium]